MSNLRKLTEIILDPSFFESFPIDVTGETTSRQTRGFLGARARPNVVAKPTLLAWSEACGELLQIAEPEKSDRASAELLTGNKLFKGSTPLATRYGGHQFGNWAGQLGDGRAILLGTLSVSNKKFELQFKGAGVSAYSRRADGRAVLRSSLREFLCSEAMFHLGVPTTRALSLCLTGEDVTRDMLYDGNTRDEPGAIVMRVSESFLRFGHFEILASTGELELLKKLVDETVREFFGEINEADFTRKMVLFFNEVSARTAHLMSKWLRVGFVHGVMNTDNLSILGLTIDYGPYGFIESYDPLFTPNTTDLPGRRYAFGRQPSIAYWNLAKLAEALSVLSSDGVNADSVESSAGIFREGLELYRSTFENEYLEMMKGKLGIVGTLPEVRTVVLIETLDQAMRLSEIDSPIFYRKLIDWKSHTSTDWFSFFKECFYEDLLPENTLQAWTKWFNDYDSCLQEDALGSADVATHARLRRERMSVANPYFILRNSLVHKAIQEFESTGNDSKIQALMIALKTPYEENEFTRPFFVKRPEWARTQPGAAQLSCSS